LSTQAPSTTLGSLGAVADSLKMFYEKRWLIRYMAQRQVARTYQGSYLGLIWAFLSPLLMVALLTLIFSELIGIKFREVTGNPSLNFGIFLYCGLLPFLTYSQALSRGVSIIQRNNNLVQGVVFPLEILPLTTIVAALLQNVFGIGALLVVLVALGESLHLTTLLLPLVLIPQLLFTLGLCYLVAVAGTYVPDIRETLRAVIRGTFFITPILWPTGRVPEEWSFLVDYNPLAVLVNAYRDLIINGELPGLESALWFSLFAAALFVVGLFVFDRVKHNFADLI
jgi:ABC-type polysaccharide/polyol phosphate export permease